MLVWLTFFGVAAAAGTRSQIVVDTVLELVSPRARRVLEAIGALAGLVAVGFLVWTSQPLFGPASRSTSPATGIPSFWIYLAVPVGGALLGLFALADLARLLRGEPPPSVGPGTAADSPPSQRVVARFLPVGMEAAERSVAMVLYASLANVSLGRLLLAGFLPGFVIVLFLMVDPWVLRARRDPGRQQIACVGLALTSKWPVIFGRRAARLATRRGLRSRP